MAVVEPLVRTSPAAPKRPVAPSDERAVVRTAILNRLCAANDGTIVTIVAPLRRPMFMITVIP